MFRDDKNDPGAAEESRDRNKDTNHASIPQNDNDVIEGKGETADGVTEPLTEDETRAADEDAAAEEQPATAEETEATEEIADAESERFLRLAAEFDNYRKRTAREFQDVVRSANTHLLRSLVEIVDNFERALSHDTANNDGDAYRRGVELIYNQLADLLQKEHVTPIEAVGQPFDPNFHDAMMQAESDEYAEGIVCQEIQKGYKLNDKVLRHARVIVSKGMPEKGEEDKEQD